jgi:single-strand DNA-binding protein
MSLNLNQLHLAGNLVADPELKTVGDTQLCKLRVATNEKWKNKAGEKMERATFFDVDVWGAHAAPCAQYLSKGQPVYIQGKMECQETEKDGQKRKFWSVRADSVQFLGNRADGPNIQNQVTANDPKPRMAKASAAADPEDSAPF